jgi:hemerythrin-like domain-containing protein
MMSATQQLKDEHEGILLMLRILDKIAAKIEAQGSVDPHHLDRIVEFLRVFADKCHHGKEEDLLFPELEKSGISRERGPIGVMLAEHQQGRAFVRGMAKAAAQHKEGDAKGGTDFAENARGYIALLTLHIGKENNVLFPMADRVLSEKTQKALEEGFEKIERERIGEGTHEGFHKLLHHLQEIFLKG